MEPLTESQAEALLADELHPKLAQVLARLEVIEQAVGLRKQAFRPSGISLSDLIAHSIANPKETA